MVERKIKGVLGLAIFSILLVVIFSGVVSAECLGTFPCASLSDKENYCQSHPGCTWNNQYYYCEDGEASCSYWKDNQDACESSYGCIWELSDEGTCTDGIKNSDEITADCGGRCDSIYTKCYIDSDGDLYAYSLGWEYSSACRDCSGTYNRNEGALRSLTERDCNDNNANIYPGRSEVCSSSTDYNCDNDPYDGCCNSHDYTSCYGGDLYWYDSCDNREEKYKDCGTTYLEYKCVANTCDSDILVRSIYPTCSSSTCGWSTGSSYVAQDCGSSQKCSGSIYWNTNTRSCVACYTDECTIDDECGSTSYGSWTCHDGDTRRRTVTTNYCDTDSHPYTCEISTSTDYSNCGGSTPYCSSGACVECRSDPDCNSGWVGGTWCSSSGDVMRHYTTEACSGSGSCYPLNDYNAVYDDCNDCQTCEVGVSTCNWNPSYYGTYDDCPDGSGGDAWYMYYCNNQKETLKDSCDSNEQCSSGACKIISSCGDGTLTTSIGEECDDGGDNGIVCDPGYDPDGSTSCTWCTSGSVSSGGCDIEREWSDYCGDGTVQSSYENCEGNSTRACSSISSAYDEGTAYCISSTCNWDMSNCCSDESGCDWNGEREYVDWNSYRICGYHDSDPCLEWRTYDCSGSTPYARTSDGQCVACTSSSHCNDGNVCTSDSCSSYTCSNTEIPGCCTSDSQCNDGNGCTTDDCSGNTCYYYDACSAGETCISGSCQACDITSVWWSPSSGIEDGDTVTIGVSTNSACNGKDIDITIRRPILGYFDWVGTRTISSGSASRSWGVDISNEGNYYARAELSSGGESRDSGNVYISIPPPPASCGDNSCNNGETCNTCPGDCGNCCGDGSCNYGETCASCSSDCGSCCNLNNAYWSTNTATSGQSVNLHVSGSNCNEVQVNFQVRKNNLIGTEYVATPSSRTISGTSTSTSWTTISPFNGDSTPDFYFIATANDPGADSIDSRDYDDDLRVNVPVNCGNNVIDGGEQCDDGSNNGDACSPPYGGNCEYCSTGCIIVTMQGDYCGDGTCDSGYEDSGSCPDDCPVSTPTGTCGDGNIEGDEECDDGDTSSGDGCSSLCIIEYGWECSGEPSTCWRSCGDGNQDSGEECDDGNTASGDGCSSSCTVEDPYICVGWPSVCTIPTTCSIKTVYWSETEVQEGKTAHINIETSNCDNGEVIMLTVKEDDPVGDDDVLNNPSNVQVSSNRAAATWTAEYQDDTKFGDDGGDPEYYVEAEIISNGNTGKSNLPTLTVTEINFCDNIHECEDYSTQEECELDDCTIAERTMTNCGFEIDPITRCYFANDCSCKWDSVQGICESFRDDSIDCGGCGNGVFDFGTEECDDGNRVSGDGCSENCELEIIPSPPCPEGTTLCSDGTCSLNCWFTDDGPAVCNNDTVCDADEGCTCRDCDGKLDNCEAGLLCSINDGACCDSISDGYCHPYCAYIDPDCEGQDICGNGFRGFGEECDDGNTLNGDGCSSICEYEIFPGPPCPEGTILCNDGTCSLNCYATDEGVDPSCMDSSCCAAGLKYSIRDNACCNSITDGYCHPYCAFYDPDCGVGIFGGITGIGSCSYTKNSDDDCEDGILKRDYSASWEWDETNVFYNDPESNDYTEDPAGVWHYDPLDLTGKKRSERCVPISDELICPAQIELPAFSTLQMTIAILLIALAYTIIVFKRKK